MNKRLIEQFISSYSASKSTDLEAWLNNELAAFPNLWPDEAARKVDARDLVAQIQRLNANKAALYKHLEGGSSQESFIEQQITDTAKISGVDTSVLVSNHLQAYNHAQTESAIAIDQNAQPSQKPVTDVRWDNEISREKASRQIREMISSITKLWAVLRGQKSVNSINDSDARPVIQGNPELAAYFKTSYKDSSQMGLQVAVAAAMMVADRMNRLGEQK
jgi:hypothetical protein